MLELRFWQEIFIEYKNNNQYKVFFIKKIYTIYNLFLNKHHLYYWKMLNDWNYIKNDWVITNNAYFVNINNFNIIILTFFILPNKVFHLINKKNS